MTTLFEAPHDLVERFLRMAAAAGLSAEHLLMLLANPHLLKEWIASLPDPEPADVIAAPITTIGAAARVTLEEAFPNGKVDERIIVHLGERMGLKYLDELARLCSDELLDIRNFGPATLRRVESVLAKYGLQLAVHQTPDQHVSFVLPFGGGWGVLYANATNVRVNKLANARIALGHEFPTVGEFRAMSNEQQLELFDEWSIRLIIDALTRYRI